MHLGLLLAGPALLSVGSYGIVLPNPPGESSAPPYRHANSSVEIEFFPQRWGPVSCYFAAELWTSARQELFQASRSADALPIRSALVLKGEGGSVVELYHRRNDAKPALAISFVIDVHQAVRLTHFDYSYQIDNVQVLVHPETHRPGVGYERITLRKIYPQILNLQVPEPPPAAPLTND